MNHYVLEAVLKEKRQDMLREAERLRHVREYEKNLRKQAKGRHGKRSFPVRMLGNLEVAAGGMLIRAGVWLTKRQMRREYSLACKSS